MYKMHRIQDSKHEIHFFRTEARKRKTIISEAWKLEEKIKEILYLIGIPYISKKFFLTLDVGCGMGGWSKILTKEGLNVTAIDISSESIKIAKNQFKAERINVPTIIGDMTMAPFKSEVFNICFCVQILHHFPDLNFIIPDLSRILTDNGKIILIEPNGSNIIFKIIKFIKEIIPKGWMVKKHLTTMNETAHDVKSYHSILKSNNLITSKITYFFSAEQALTHQKKVIKGYFYDHGILAGFLLFMRYLSLRIVLNVFPKDLGMGSVLMTAKKHTSSVRKTDYTRVIITKT